MTQIFANSSMEENSTGQSFQFADDQSDEDDADRPESLSARRFAN